MYIYLDPGRPLDEDDFFLATQLQHKLMNSTTEEMMRPPQQLTMEELEAIGEQTVKKMNNGTRNVNAHVR